MPTPKSVLRKIYLSLQVAAWALGAIAFAWFSIASTHDWWLVHTNSRCFKNGMSRGQASTSFVPDDLLRKCSVEFFDYDKEFRVKGGWIDPTYELDAVSPMWMLLASLLCFVPAILLVLFRKWLIWVLR